MMKTPFSAEQFFQIFKQYNESLFPVQIIILLIGVVAVLLLHSQLSLKHRIIGGITGFLWIWTGVIYHLVFFTSINNAAYVFSFIFMLEGVLILIESFVTKKLEFRFENRAKDYFAYFFILFGLIIYPLIGYLIEGDFEKVIALGLPCPSTIFTFGFLMLTSRKFPKYLLIIPTLWTLVGVSAAINFGVYQDFVMLMAAIIADIWLLGRKKEKAISS